MARDPRAQQKKKERRNQREKRKKQLARRATAVTPLTLVAHDPDAPVRACAISRVAFTQGIGNLLVVRELPTGVCVAVTFLVDLYCLGIKNVAVSVLSRSGVAEYARKMYANEPAEQLTAPEAKKLIAGAVAFAAKYGLHPHAEFAEASAIFAGIDESTCETEFEFGKDGKPFYINGPRDSATFQRRVRDTLNRTAGPGNWDFLIMTGDPNLMDVADGDDAADGDDEFDDGPAWGDLRSLRPR